MTMSSIAGALASAQMTAETLKNLLVQTTNRYSLSVRPVIEVFSASDVPAGGDLGVARFAQPLSKSFKQRYARTIAKRLSS